MTKKYIVISTCVFILVVSSVIGKYVFEKKQIDNTTPIQTSTLDQIQEGGESEVEKNDLTAEEIQAELDAIMNDDSIDISDWPTFTNTKYGWSIKYHPSGYWVSNSMMDIPEEAPAPSYYLLDSSNSKLMVNIIENREGKVLDDIVKIYAGMTVFKKMNHVYVNRLNMLVDWKNKNFYFEDQETKKVFNIGVNRNIPEGLLRKLIKSIMTFEQK